MARGGCIDASHERESKRWAVPWRDGAARDGKESEWRTMGWVLALRPHPAVTAPMIDVHVWL